jgi:O-methyltransferase involved in polyketide biosynthesis
MYLTRAAVKQTLAMLRDLCAPSSELVMDFWFLLDAPDLRAAAHRLSANLLHLLGEPVLFGIHPEDARPFFDANGYRIVDLGDAPALAIRYVEDGRSVYPAMFVAHTRMGA